MQREHETAKAKDEDQLKKPEMVHEEKEVDTKFAGGKPPPVKEEFNERSSASDLAYEEDDNERELKMKVSALVAKKYEGDYKKAFEHYAHDGNVGKGELMKLLSDAGVGNGLTRGVWASKIIDRLDRDNDAAIQWDEFENVFHMNA
jgi:hypothetical protein